MPQDWKRRAKEPPPGALKVSLAFAELPELVERFGQNVSEAGIFIRSRDPRPLGTRLSFELRLKRGDVVLAGAGIVRFVRPPGGQDAGSPGMGLQFETLTPASRRLVQQIAAEREAGRVPPPVAGTQERDWPPLAVLPPPAPLPLPAARETPPVLAPEPFAVLLSPAPSPVAPEPEEKTDPLFGAQGAEGARAGALFEPGPGRLARAPVVAPPVMAPGSPADARRSRAGASAALVGVALGWSKLSAAVKEGESARAIPLGSQGPSAVCVAERAGELVFGEAAEEALEAGAPGARGLMRLLGAWPGARSLAAFERRELARVVAAEEGRAGLMLAGRARGGAELLEGLLRSLRERLERQLGREVTRVAFAVPSALPASARRELWEAATRAGFQPERLVPAPLALAGSPWGQRVLVVEVDDGGLEAAVVEAGALVATASDADVGGAEIDLAVVAALLQAFEEETGIALPEEPGLFERVRRAAAAGRERLAAALETEVHVPDLLTTGLATAELRQRLARARVHALATPLIERAAELVRLALGQRGLGLGEVDEVVVGPSAGPLLAHLLSQRLGREVAAASQGAAAGAALLGDATRPAATAALGATIWAALPGGVPRRLVERGAPLPAERTYAALQANAGERELELHLWQGERTPAGENDFLGVAVAGPLPAAGRGPVQLSFTALVDESGQLVVAAKEAGSGRQVPVRFEARPP